MATRPTTAARTPLPTLSGGQVTIVRECLGMTQAQLAEAVGVRRKTVGAWEQSHTVLAGARGLRIMLALARVLRAHAPRWDAWRAALGAIGQAEARLGVTWAAVEADDLDAIDADVVDADA